MATTMTETSSPETLILQNHKKFLESDQADPVFRPFNESAIRKFEELKFPHRKHEMYTFVNTRDLVATPFNLAKEEPVPVEFIRDHVYEGCESSYLVVVDGVLRSDLSDISAIESSLNLIPLQDALTRKEIREYMQKTIEEENDVFACVNSAFFRHGTLLEIPRDTQLSTPLQILHVSTGSSEGYVTTHPRLVIQLGLMAELKLIVRYIGLGNNYFINSVQDILVGEDAQVTCTQVQEDVNSSWNFSRTRVSLDRNSRFLAANASSGNRLSRHHFEAHLNQVGAELRLNAVSILADEEQVHHYVRIYHEAPHTTSNQHFKNIVNDQSRSSVDGTVVVQRGAQLTNSDQLINNLMLSDNAHADNKPNLMIFADDVKCTHGATVGQIDMDQLFYLETRGLSPKTARELLTKSFAQSIIQTIEFPSVVRDLEQSLLKKLEV